MRSTPYEIPNSDNSLYIESYSRNRVWADNLIVQAASYAYTRNIEIITEHGRTLTIDARQSIGPNLVITFNSENQHYQSIEETSVHFNIGNIDVDRHDKDGGDSLILAIFVPVSNCPILIWV